jgi:hypothetical protein
LALEKSYPVGLLLKLFLSVLKCDTGIGKLLDHSTGQISGIEAAIHAMRSTFDDETTQGILLVARCK